MMGVSQTDRRIISMKGKLDRRAFLGSFGVAVGAAAATAGPATAQTKRTTQVRKPDDEGNTSFELPESSFEERKPGFTPATKARVVPKGDEEFPVITPEKDIPRESLAERIRKARKTP
jgi:hypothetical protein